MYHNTRRFMSKSNDNIFERRNEFNRPSPRRVSEYSINHGSGYRRQLTPPGPFGDPGGGGIPRGLSRDHYPYRMGSRDGNNSNTIIEMNNVSRGSLGSCDPNRQSGMYIDRQPEDEYVYTDHFGPDPANYGCCSEMWCLTKYGPECLPIRASAVSFLDTVKPYAKYVLLMFVTQITTLIILALSQNNTAAAAPPPPP
jgi:hypothetical protein